MGESRGSPRFIQLCAKHKRSKITFHEQAVKAGKSDVLVNIESTDPQYYLTLLRGFCDTYPLCIKTDAVYCIPLVNG